MAAAEVLLQYESRIRDLRLALEHAQSHSAVAAAVLGIAAALFLVLSTFALRQQASVLWPSTTLPIAVAAARRLHSHRQSQVRTRRLWQFYDRAVERLNGNWAGNGVTGEEFDDPHHLYARDLDVFGEGSLFELLCTARTAIGRRRLAGYLLKPPPLAATLLRQEAVRELEPQIELREKLALLGRFQFRESRPETFEQWLDAPPLPHSRFMAAAALITSGILALIFLCALTGLIPWINACLFAIPLVAFHVVVGRIF